MNQNSTHFELHDKFDVVMARQHARQMARELGFGLTDQTRIATAVSEVSSRALGNLGIISFAEVQSGSRRGLECICLGCEWQETAPNLPGSPILGGIRGVEQLMDDFEVEPNNGKGTAIVMRKWL